WCQPDVFLQLIQSFNPVLHLPMPSVPLFIGHFREKLFSSASHKNIFLIRRDYKIPTIQAYNSVNIFRNASLSRSSCSVISACPLVYPFPTIIVTSLPTPSAPKAAFVKL